jgi:hypothetical protein
MDVPIFHHLPTMEEYTAWRLSEPDDTAWVQDAIAVPHADPSIWLQVWRSKYSGAIYCDANRLGSWSHHSRHTPEPVILRQTHELMFQWSSDPLV